MNDEREQDLVVRQAETLPGDWTGAAQRGLLARQEREAIIGQILTPGTDFGRVPGTDKDTLFKPGSEKISDALNLYPDYEALERLEDWERPLFFYRYRCRLRARGTEVVISTGIGSCNSQEGRYRWRYQERSCPSCGREAIIKGRAEYGGGWLCFKKKGGCGAKFADGAQEIESQQPGRVENDDAATLVNTIDKMAQKRALVAAVLNLGFSEHFTQDLEDLKPAGRYDEPEVQQPQRASTQPDPPAQSGDWRGVLESVTEKSGETRGRNWTLYTALGADGTTFGTFSKRIGAALQELAGEEVVIIWQLNKRGNREVQEVVPAEAE